MNARATYLRQMVTTASGPSLLVMLVNRLATDAEGAVLAQEAGDHAAAARLLVHAQDVVSELRTTLDLEIWPEGRTLAAVYDWLYRELVRANIGRDVEVTRGCAEVARQVASTWQEAAGLPVPA